MRMGLFVCFILWGSGEKRGFSTPALVSGSGHYQICLWATISLNGFFYVKNRFISVNLNFNVWKRCGSGKGNS